MKIQNNGNYGLLLVIRSDGASEDGRPRHARRGLLRHEAGRGEHGEAAVRELLLLQGSTLGSGVGVGVGVGLELGVGLGLGLG